jgi:N-acylneuraminate cytidylyltransferase
MSVVAIIAARGGSKGLPGKNLADFCGKPLLAWSIEQAATAASIDSVWVSSDSAEILAVATDHGARAIERPAPLATDDATSEAAWLHAVDAIESSGDAVDLVVAMQATSPLRTAADLDRGVREFSAQGCDSLFSGAPLEDFFIWRRGGDDRLQSVNYDWEARTRRQDHEEQFVENGSFYVFPPALLRESGNRLGGRIGFSPMELWKSFEIDSREDLELCETLMRHYLIDEAA